MDLIKLTLGSVLLVFFISENSFGQSDSTRSGKNLEKRFFESGDIVEKHKIFEEIIQYYPQDSQKNSYINYDAIRRVLALNYLVSSDTINFKSTINLIRDKEFLSSSLNEVAEHWSKVKPLQTAALKACEVAVLINDSLLNNFKTIKASNIDNKHHLEKQQIRFASTYAYVLNSLGHSRKALQVMDSIYNDTMKTDFRFLEYYGLILAKNGFLTKSDNIINKLLVEGYSSSDLDKQLKENYINKHKNDIGFEEFKQGIYSRFRVKYIESISKNLLNIPAPQFTLRTANGDAISFEDYKGKVIVIDFWSSWCTPCLDMFPTMQKLTEQYKSNESVEFIFINTLENVKNYQDIVKSFMSRYRFNFLIDEIDELGKQQKTSNLFLVKALPTKIIIDQYGMIKFREEGFSGSEDQLFTGMTTKIDYLLSLPSKSKK